MHELNLSNQDSVEEATIDTEVTEFMIGTKIKNVKNFDDGTYTPAPNIETMPELERDDQLGGK